MAHQDTMPRSRRISPGSSDPTVGEIGSGWYAVHACGWLETGFASYLGAKRMLERHIAFVCAAPTCHHP
jgi:hypothetical protein